MMTTASSSHLDTMNFLNEIPDRYPDAISFASGRPASQFFRIEQWIGELDRYADADGESARSARFAALAQYGRTAGIVQEAIARQLAADEQIACEPEQIVVTAGCQEAMDLCVKAVCSGKEDVILTRNACYVGIIGVALVNGKRIVPIDEAASRTFAESLAATIEAVLREGCKPKLLYLVPDFDNPSGTVISCAERQAILNICARNEVLVLEDDPYGLFRYEGEDIAPMFALDEHGCVIYLGTYSKTLCPTLRIGFALFPVRLFGHAAPAVTLANRVVQFKSFSTVNTSQITQAIVGGVLASESFSLRGLTAAPCAHYRRNRDTMLEQLDATMPDATGGVRWNRPEGGFFLCVELPFRMGRAEVTRCAQEHGVIVMPVSLFTLDDAHERRVRLAFSNVVPDAVTEGVKRFASYVADALATR